MFDLFLKDEEIFDVEGISCSLQEWSDGNGSIEYSATIDLPEPPPFGISAARVGGIYRWKLDIDRRDRPSAIAAVADAIPSKLIEEVA